MKPVLYRYRDSESVIKHMDGYTPGEGREPLYSQDQISSAVNAALEATAPDERVKELEAELAATEIAIAEYRQQCLDNAAEIARLRSESEERLQNCAALVAENERLRAAPATAPAQPERKPPQQDASLSATTKALTFARTALLVVNSGASQKAIALIDDALNQAPVQAQVLNPLTDGEKIYALWHSSDANDLDDFLDGWRHAEAFHGITGDKQ